jgi:hypothetical protein
VALRWVEREDWVEDGDVLELPPDLELASKSDHDVGDREERNRPAELLEFLDPTEALPGILDDAGSRIQVISAFPRAPIDITPKNTLNRDGRSALDNIARLGRLAVMGFRAWTMRRGHRNI